MLFLTLYCATALKSQSCDPPIIAGFSNYTTQGVNIRWNDFFNSDPLGWEIEIGEVGFTRTMTPTTPLILDENYTFNSLVSATRYEFYIRTVCSAGNSIWNGPFFFTTNIDNPSNCGIDLAIDDNKCPINNIFRIEVSDQVGNLGDDIILEELSLIIEHPWPPDLKVVLRSPSSKSIGISSHIGIGTLNYGEVDSDSCEQPVSFRPDACLSVASTTEPIRSTLRPVGDFNTFLDGTPANGIWQLEICDRAQGDIGQLKFAGLSFVPQACPLPFFSIVNDIDSDQAIIRWEAPPNCNVIEIEVGPKGFTPGTVVARQVNCSLESFTLPNLQADTEYEVYYRSRCAALVSAYSCPLSFRTPCQKKTISHNFDMLSNCATSCNSACEISGFWHNVSSDDTDWIVNSGATPTSFTGPDSDFYNFGKYLYIENSRSACGNRPEAVLESDCFLVTSDTSVCQLQFAYHMNGLEIDELRLEITQDDGLNWNPLFSKVGMQDENWLTENINLSSYLDEYCRLRFTAVGSTGNFGDIAIDQIDFFVAELTDGNRLFADNDGDGFGDGEQLITPCSSIIPAGFVKNDEDCNDNDSAINPDSNEIPCNLIDENCNGIDDDLSASNNLDYTLVSTNNETCRGSQDGFIQLAISGGSGSSTVEWNTGLMGEIITGLEEGVYWAEITDASGCKVRTEFIEIDAIESITIITNNIEPASCFGISDGSIDISHSGSFGPFNYLWSNGSTAQDLTSATAGEYTVSITDNRGCVAISEIIIIPERPNIVAGVQLKQNISCKGKDDGSILLGVSQGQAPYSFSWSSGHTTQAIDSLQAGLYSVTIIDALECIRILKDIEILEPDSLTIRVDSREDISCPDNEDGQILITAIGGTTPITYQWSNGSITDDIFALAPGMYSVTATDARSCTVVLDSIDIQSPPAIEISVDSVSQVACPLSNDGYIGVNIAGGRGTYFYSWSSSSVNSGKISDLLPGFYNITVIDEFNCKASLNQIEVEAQNLPIQVDASIIIDNNCFDESAAILSVVADSDRFPIDYNWSAGQQNLISSKNDTIYNLPSGNYMLTVTDNEGCTGISNVLSLDSFDIYRANLVSKINNDCFGDTLGSIDIEIEGGLPPFVYNWSDGIITEDRDNLPAGLYQISVRDNQDCLTLSQEINILSPDSLVVDALITDASPGQNNGHISLSIEGGVSPYSILWSNTSGNTDLENLAPGTYTVEIIDANGCLYVGEYMVDMISSISTIEEFEMILSPNPAKDVCYLQLEEEFDIMELYLVDLTGQKLLVSWEILQQDHFIKVDLRGIRPSIYLVKAITKNGARFTSKLVVTE